MNLDQRRFGRLVSRHALLLLVCIVLGAAVAAGITFAKGTTYTSTTQLRVANPLTLPEITNNTTNNNNSPIVTLSDQVALLSSDSVKDQVKSVVGTPPSFTPSITAGQTGQVVTIKVTSTSADTAARAAKAYTDNYLSNLASRNAPLFNTAIEQLSATIKSIDGQVNALLGALKTASPTTLSQVQAQINPQVQQLESQRSDVSKQLTSVQLAKAVTPAGNATVLSPPATVKNGRSITTIVIGAIAGLVIGLLLAGVREARFGRVVDEGDVERYGLPVLATIAAPLPRRLRSAVAALGPGRDVAAYREAAVLLAPPHATEMPRRWLISSVDADGAAGAVLAGRLARHVAQMGRRIVLVDCAAGSSRRPSPTGSQPGLAEVLRGEVPLAQAIALDGSSNVAVMPAGNGLGAMPEPLASAAFAGVLDGLADRFDIILLTGAPLEQSADSYLLAPLADLIVVGLVRGVTRRNSLQEASPRLATVIGEARIEAVLLGARKGAFSRRGPEGGEQVIEAPVKQPARETRSMPRNPVPLHGSAS